jgi:hypothetical protein
MNKFVVVVFPDENAAYGGVRAFKELHAAGSLTVLRRGGDREERRRQRVGLAVRNGTRVTHQGPDLTLWAPRRSLRTARCRLKASEPRARSS